MKLSLLLVAGSVVLFGQAAVAQKNIIMVDARYFRVSDHQVWGTTLGFFRKVQEKQEIGAKVVYSISKMINKPDLGYRSLEYSVTNFDLTSRWKLSNKQKFNWFAELGISGLLQTQRWSPYQVIFEEPVTPEERQKFLDYASKWHAETSFYTGFASAINWEYSITPKFAIGINCLANLYFSSEYDELFLPFFIPSLHSAYRF